VNPPPDSTLADPHQLIADLQRKLKEAEAERDEALAQQTATAEVLEVINASPGNLVPVFDAMLEKALSLCEAVFGVLWTYDGERVHVAASRGDFTFPEELIREGLPTGPESRDALGRLIRGESIVHITDVIGDPDTNSANPLRRLLLDMGGRTLLAAPLRKDAAFLGYFVIYRQEVRPFTDKQIALLQNFAAQAVIAIENARLLGELRQRTDALEEALEYQTATSEVLKVISQSDADLTYVLQTALDTAARLCNAEMGHIFMRHGERLQRMASSIGVSTEWRADMDANPVAVDAHSTSGRAVLTGQVVQIADIAADPEYAHTSTGAAGIRTMLGVPLLRDGAPIGSISLARKVVEPFTDRQIELVRTFADQAVIAIENARLLGDLRERTDDLQQSLDYQTATSDVLKVISHSAFDLQPVLNTLVQTAVRLCEADFGHIDLPHDGVFRPAAALAFSPEFDAVLRRTEFVSDPGTTVGRVLLEKGTVHVADVTRDPNYAFTEAVTLGNVHTVLGVPLLREGEIIGVFALGRERAEGFTQRQVELVNTFADQAVIAIENTRLITETREALEQQTATAEVLGVINASPGDLGPVFEVMVERAAHLCEADEAAVRSFDGESLHLVTTHGTDPSALERLRGLGPTELEGLYAPFADGTAVVHYVDARDTNAYRTHPVGRQRIDARGIRSWLAVALRKEGTLLGIINVHRREVRPFTEKQIALLQNFAAQAVIAMENARLLEEIRQRQTELRATFDNMGDGVVMFDAEQRLAAWNRNFQELLDLPDAVVADRPSYGDYLRVLAERGEFGTDDVEAELARRLRDTDQELRLERERPDGRVIEVRRNAVPDGGFVLIYSDITERKRSEAEIRAARDAAEAAYHDLQAAQASLVQAQKMAALGQLTAGIAHEIKNPLNFVNNFASLSTELLYELKEEVAPALATLDSDKRGGIDETIEMLTGNLDKIVEHGQRADNIVKSMLEHSRGVSGERRQADLNALVEEALNLAYHGARAQDQNFNITLERDYTPALAMIEVAPQEMTRVLLNLIGNGFYAANKRAKANVDATYRPTLSVATREDEHILEVRVRDNGTGIPSELKDKLFQPFFTTKPTGEGTGLGLSISYDIVTQQHGGTITVESELGSFTEFTIRLPRR
jgi:two-component system NtrC family sensor kinase